MTQDFFSPGTVLFWHGWANDFAYTLLTLLFFYAVMQYGLARSKSTLTTHFSGRSLKANYAIGLIMVGVIPSLSLTLLLAERTANERHQRTAARIEDAAEIASGDIDRFIDKHFAGIISAAQAVTSAGEYDPDSITRWLMLFHDTYPDFLTMLGSNSHGDILSATSNMSGILMPAKALGQHNVSDRSYFRGPMADGAPFISSVFQGRDLGSDPIVALSAPYRDSTGRVLGVIEGSLNLQAFGDIEVHRLLADDAVMILVDEDKRVIFASDESGLAMLRSLTSDPLTTAVRTTGIGQSVSYVSEDVHGKRQFLAASATTRNDWTVYVRAPLDGITKHMVTDYKTAGLLLILAILLSLLIATTTVRRVDRSVADMNKAVAKFSLDGHDGKVTTPANTPDEFRPVFKQMRSKSKQLRNAYSRLNRSIEAGDNLRKELIQVISGKEAEIADRTAELEEANLKLSGLSRSDALTGIANRREFEAVESRIWRNGGRSKTPVAMAMIDIDYFKIFNDTLGHHAGDECLRKVAQTLHDCITRPLDVVARYGGEEFVAVMDGASIEDALVLAERMRRAVFDLGVTHPGSAHAVVTVSIGVFSSIPNVDNGSAGAIKAADESLYYAKAAGRNCVVYSDSGEYVTYDPTTQDTGATNVIAILSGSSTKKLS